MIDTRRYQWMVGAIGLALVIAFSIFMYLAPAHRTHPGVAAGHRLRRFVAPLATSDLNVPANAAPRCNPAHPARRGLNVCDRGPMVLAFFATDGKPCVRAVSALQRLAPQFPQASFAAVAAGGSKQATLKLVRKHHWTLPVAYDSSAVIAQLYDVSVCPLIEVAGRGGTVRRLLIGERWSRPAALVAVLRRVLFQKR
ncbi:MAG: redoxin domain-containing protein [Acidobacteriota bacterium]|nr:redoxin domain-containing protein [Acidobacteriota bacterium]